MTHYQIRKEYSMKNDYRRVLRALAVSFLSAASLLSFYAYAVAQGFDISVNFTVGKISPNVSLNGPISTIGVDPDNELNVLVASESGGLFRSSDGALTWRHEDSLPTNKTVDIAYLGGGRVIVTAAMGFEVLGGGVWIRGGPWPNWTNLARAYSLFPAPGAQCSATPGAHGLAVAPDSRQIYVATDCGVAIGSPDARSWRHVEIVGASNFRSITALGGGHLIAGGHGGVWYSRDDGMTWNRETTRIRFVWSIHGLSRDPRGGDRAYAINTSKQLYETTNGGSTWTQIMADPEYDGCGGIAFAKAVQDGSQIRLYFGDRCNTRVTSFDATSEPTTGTPAWVLLNVDHMDTRDLAFHPGTANPYLMSSDGGLERTTDGINFHWVGFPPSGLDANEISEIRGQYVGTGPSPDMYFATWHNGIWGVSESRTAGLCPEGWGLGVLRTVPNANDVKISAGCIGQNVNPNRLFENVGVDDILWPDTAQRLPPPVILSQNKYVQIIEPAPEYPLRTRGLQYTTDTGATWRQIVDIPEELKDLPKPVGPPSDPTLIQAIHTDTTTSGQQVIGLVRVSGFSLGGTGSMRRARMRGFGTIGLLPTPTADWIGKLYEVYAVDPNDATHIVAADAFTNNIKVSTNGGDRWREIPDLTDLVSHHGEYLMGQPAALMGLGAVDRVASLVSSISFCPDNSSRVLLGTQKGGAYFSYDGGQTWTPVTGSDGIVPTTSFFWLNGCDSAWASTWGRGIWQIDMALRFQPLVWSELLCKRCPWRKITIDLLRDEHPDPKSIQALLAVDGQITAVNQSGGITLVSVSQGTVLAKYGDLPNLKVVFEKYTSLPAPSLSKQRVIQGVLFKNEKMSLITGASRLELYSRVPGKMGAGKAKSPASKKPSIDVISRTRAFGTPAIMSGEPLIVRVSKLGSVHKEILVLQIDGKDVAKVDSSQRVFEYVDKLTEWPMGRHVVALVAYRAKGRQTLWVTDFLVPHDDSHLKLKKT